MAIGSSPCLPTSGITSLDDVGQERRAEAEGNQQEITAKPRRKAQTLFSFTRRLMAQLPICKYKSKIIWKFTTDSIIDDLYAKKNRKVRLK
ncbi:hypothetical protein PVAP13_9NG702700 [Panicum virgatum]|uniref:Uncharacterized protein n=1 Tax=Panicum virgatum TaxID=38727 RepID=A0A8T0MWG0_PANVG|nr:hypothetical protein PVAP13_9NG702700 [Panicum virgatum]